MAKYRHRIFEMYDFRDETIRALTPKSGNGATEDAGSQSWTFASFRATRKACVAHLQFNIQSGWEEESVIALRNDFDQLAKRLGKDSRVLLDFTGVRSFSAAAIDALVQFKKKLRIQGSNLALCCLDPEARRSFFPESPESQQTVQSDSASGSD